MFSVTTIESSTTRPIAIVMAPSVRMFSEYCAACIPIRVMSTDVGMLIAVTSVARMLSRNSRITTTAKTRPRPPSCSSESIDCVMNGAWSNTGVNAPPAPSEERRPGSASATSCETCTVFASGSFVTETVSAGLPFTSEIGGDRVHALLHGGDVADARRARQRAAAQVPLLLA